MRRVHTKYLRHSGGLVYVLLFIAGFAAGPQCGSITSSAFDACLLDSTPKFGAQAFLHGLAVLAFLIFLGDLWARVRTTDEATGSSQILMLLGGILWAGLWLIGLGLTAAASDPGDFQVNAAGARSTLTLTNALLLSEASGILYLPLALFLGATAEAAKRTESLPIWLTTSAVGLALLFIAASGLQLIFEAWLIFPMLPLFIIWMIAVNVVILREAR